AHQGQGYITKALPAICTVDGCRLVDRRRNRIKPGKQEQHPVARTLPGRDADQRVECLIMAAVEWLGTNPDPFEEAVHRPEISIKEKAEQHCTDAGGD